MITDPNHFLNDTTWKDKTIEGSVFPGKPYVFKEVVLNDTIKNEYLPLLKDLEGSRGAKLFVTYHAHQEGFKKGTRAYLTNNPGNIGNTDSGANNKIASLKDGIKLQLDFLYKVAQGHHPQYKIGSEVKMKPYYSDEIARNCVKYQKSPYCPGYHFTYTGQLQQYIKKYATGARTSNNYEYGFVSYFQQNGLIITPETTLLEIINLK